MKTLRIMLLELKKSLSANGLLCLILMLSIMVSYSVFLYTNDSFFREQRKYLSSQLSTHSVTVDFGETVSYQDARRILEGLGRCEYAVLSFDAETKDERYRISSVSSLLPLEKNPYEFLYSAMTQTRCLSEPEGGKAYIDSVFISGRKGTGLLMNAPFSVDGHSYVVSDICSVSWEGAEVLLAEEDFKNHDRVDRLTYVYREGLSLSGVKAINDGILRSYPAADFTIHRQMPELVRESYDTQLRMMVLLLAACILNYCLIFSYLAQKRSEDYQILRLFGITRSSVALVLLLEFMLYNLSAFALSTVGFLIYWKLRGEADLGLHLTVSLPVILAFLAISLVIGLLYVARLYRRMPAAYRERG